LAGSELIAINVLAKTEENAGFLQFSTDSRTV